jgi:hypothetical protein
MPPSAPTDPWWPDANPQALLWVRTHGISKPSWDELKSRLEYISKPPGFPLEAIRCAQAAWPDYASQFRQVLADGTEDPARCADGRYALHIFAGSLLAEHRDAQSFDIVQRWMALPLNALHVMLGDSWHETLGSWLAAFCCQVPDRIQWLAGCAKNASLFAGKRHVALEALARCCSDGYAVHAFQALCLEVMQDVAQHGCREEPEDFMDAPGFMGLALCTLMDVGLPEDALPQIRQWYEDGRIDPSIVSYNGVLDEIRTPKLQHAALPGCTVKEIGWWAWFKEEPDQARDSQPAPWTAYGGASSPEESRALGLPYLRPESKVGRNDPCPCGSGRKFKKCCGA